jgi:hypothetical protein
VILPFSCPNFSNPIPVKWNITLAQIKNCTPEKHSAQKPIETVFTSFQQQRSHQTSHFGRPLIVHIFCPLSMCNSNHQVVTDPATPHMMPAAPSVATSPTSLSDDADNDDKEEVAPNSSFYCRMYFKSEKAGLKDLPLLFAMAEENTDSIF